MKFSNGVLENGGPIEGYMLSVHWNELLYAALSQAISILNSPFHLIL